MPNSKECEARIVQTTNTKIGFVSNAISCQLCEIHQLEYVDRGTDEEAIKSNNQTVIEFQERVCPKLTGKFVV